MHYPLESRRLVGRWLLLAACLLLAGAARASDPVIDSPMYRDPVLPQGHIEYRFPKNLIPMWRQVLERPDADLPCQAALAITEAHQKGMMGLDVLIGPLRQALDDPNRHPTVRLAAARALIELNARAAAASLFRQAETGGLDARDLIEPALARWDYPPARSVWLDRLAHPEASPHGLVLAIRGLASVREARAVKPLRTLVQAPRVDAAIRLEAARALGQIHTSGAEADARRLLENGNQDTVRRLAAVALLRHHQGTAATLLLQESLKDTEPAVVRAALQRLVEIDPRLVLPSLKGLLTNDDAEVRLAAVRVLFREITPARLPWLVKRCNDAHPSVRTRARGYLQQLASRPEYRVSVIAQVSGLLAGNNWRGQEQAAILLAQLDHRPAGQRLVELLDSNRAEVCLAAAWGLRRMADPKRLPDVLRYVSALHKDVVSFGGKLAARRAMAGVFDAQLSQLVQFLGASRYRPAEAILRRYVPKIAQQERAPVGPEARAAAIWALGWLHENHPDADVTRMIEKPLRDSFGPNQDDFRVYRMCIIALARMRSPGALGLVRLFYRVHKPGLDQVNNAACWAVEYLSGQPEPHEATVYRTVGGWFLRPIEP